MEHQLNELMKFAKGLRLLYVEDEELSRSMTIEILKMFFDNIIVAYNGQDAYEKYNENSIDFIITDINMPKMNGIDFIKLVRKENKDIPVFILSAHSDTSFFLDSIDLGVDGYLIKPINSTQFIDQIRKKVHKLYLQRELEEYHEKLEEKVKSQVDELRAKDKILIHQAKLATMGEMMDIVAHQWKQPINVIAMHTSLVNEFSSEGLPVDKEMLSECYQKVDFQIKHLLNTLDDFRAFFRPCENIEKISLKELFDSVMLLIHDDIIKSQIKISLDIDEEIVVEVNSSEIKHIFINLINNARDEYVNKNIKPRNITISSFVEEGRVFIDTIDEAGGIPEDIINDIFKANFTSKKDSGGTGIGLYMSEFIAKKNNGELLAFNNETGAVFRLALEHI